MINLTPHLLKAIEIATAFLQTEVRKCKRLNPCFNANEVWATVSLDGRIIIGTPLLHGASGLYVDSNGSWREG